ncbi:amidohydrolase family protein [Pimelobacter simplex]|uniref:Cytosine deaminase n=1 Tax=Nocardioides simplex TaxID=2045 RepID=A0A0A1DPA8_NOCSI|nr:amidohydrolase family protein [Pimelobacter simplex]AIY19251.1 Cytosine deaminase [Pimelobacter simplex]MCG8149329.1 amidohydrolase family protein [Pimelobacter simplex]GEB16542.1 cytosine deaminase [Pimelobacter simplex]SFM20483.1 cytosine deaminase [Pimelobacter simplex]
MSAPTPHVDLLVTGARLADGSVVALGVREGRYVFVAPEPPAGTTATTTLDAEGRLVTPTFVNGHLHLEKVHSLDRAGDGALAAYTSGNMGAALRSIVREASQVKRQYDRSWLVPNIRRALDAAVENGTLHMQTFVDVDTTARLVGMEAVLEVREEYRDLLDLQVVAFPQDGLLRDPGAAELCEEALRMGADVVGGIPWIEMTDADAQAHVEWACRLANEQGKRVAMLVDDAGDPSLRTTQMLAQAMLEHGLQGRGVACHARALAEYPQPTLQRLMDLAHAAGLGFVSDPHTGPLHLPVRDFADDGIAVALGQDDVEDAYYPFGRNNMLEVAFLAAHTLRFLTHDDQQLLLELITTRAADVLGVPDHGIAVGSTADLCVHPYASVRDVLTEHARPRWVVRRGKVIAESETRTRILR